MKNKKIQEKLVYFLLVVVSFIFLFFSVITSWIGYEVTQQCQKAQKQYGGDCVESLVKVIGNEKKSYRVRNNAVWAVGQFGDRRALPILSKYYTGIIPPREPLNTTLSQYELKKAIHLASGGTNIAAIIWRNIFFNSKLR